MAMYREQYKACLQNLIVVSDYQEFISSGQTIFSDVFHGSKIPYHRWQEYYGAMIPAYQAGLAAYLDCFDAFGLEKDFICFSDDESSFEKEKQAVIESFDSILTNLSLLDETNVCNA